jgi:RNA polymerase sigma-70 factor (ECF subfamily)
MANFPPSDGSIDGHEPRVGRERPASGVEQSDLELVRRVQRGERGAFDLLVLRYQHRVVKLVARLLRDPTEAEDVAQDAFVKAYRAIGSFRGDSAFYTWLYRIAVNTARNTMASRQRRPLDYEAELSESEQSVVESRMRHGDTPEAVALSEDSFGAVLAASRRPLVVDFWAAWCGPCRGFAPVFEQAAARHPQWLFAKVDTDANPRLSQQLSIRSIPTLAVFRGGEVVDRVSGALPAAQFEQWLAAALR